MNIFLQVLDNVLEFTAVLLLIKIGFLISEIGDNDIQNVTSETTADEKTDVWWTVALSSTICTLIYGIYLSFQVTENLNYTSFFNLKDQETFDEIMSNDIYSSFYFATTKTKQSSKIIDRHLTGYEVDQLLTKLGPEYISQQA